MKSMKWTREELENLDKEELIDILLRMQELTRKLVERVQRVEDQLAKHSGNSSRPLLLVGKAEIAQAPPEAKRLSPARLAYYDQAYDRILQYASRLTGSSLFFIPLCLDNPFYLPE